MLSPVTRYSFNLNYVHLSFDFLPLGIRVLFYLFLTKMNTFEF